MRIYFVVSTVWFILLMAACSHLPGMEAKPGIDPGPVIGMGGGMMARHHAQIPDEYSGMVNPIEANQESWDRGKQVFTANCASCHGDGGMGDGPAGQSLDPSASPIAHTSQMMGDNYLYWRISEGGTPFKTSMPAWKEALSEEQRWDVINYIRALGAGQVQPVESYGGATLSPGYEAVEQAALLDTAMEQGVITPEQAENFKALHALLEPLIKEQPGTDMNTRQNAALEIQLAEGRITQAQADSFIQTHDLLITTRLEP